MAITIAALMMLAAPHADMTADAYGLDAETARVAAIVNAYRRANGLPDVALSPALTRVAAAHARDLNENRPDQQTDDDGRRCNMHSWSARSGATPVCYTADHARAGLMWGKPAELTRGAYSAQGFEIAARYSIGMTADLALELWQGSPGHNSVILEEGPFRGARWQAMGVAVDGEYALVWFGKAPDGDALDRPIRVSRR